MPILSRLTSIIRAHLRADDQFFVLLLAAIVGVGGAFCALLFRSAFVFLRHFIDDTSVSMVALATSLPWWGRLLLPMAGGALAGAILKFGLDWVPRRGADDYLEAIAPGKSVLSMRQSLIKSASSLCSITSGASIGREGPMVQLAATIGSVVARWLKLPPANARLLVACGATAGITSAYNAPIAGTLFIVEIAMGTLSKATLGPLIVSSVIANVLTRWFFGFASVYEMPHFARIEGWEVFAYAGLGIICGFMGPVFRYVLDITRTGFRRMSLGLIANMALGGLGVGIISVWNPDVWGNGYSVVNSILHTSWTWQALLIILVLKIIATALSSGSGVVGGVFTPTLFVGAAMGALYGHLMMNVSYLSHSSSLGYAIVGMGAFLAAITYAPLMSILMIFEMTLSYEVVLPLMLACVISHYIAQTIRPYSIYRQREETEAKRLRGSHG